MEWLDRMLTKTYYYSQVIRASDLAVIKGLYVERVQIRKATFAVFSAITIAGSALLISCSGGYQGGLIPQTFNGLTTAQAISPVSIQLSWDSYPGASTYKVYDYSQNAPIATPAFTTYTFQPTVPNPNTIYQYSATALDSNTNQEVGSRTDYLSVQLLPHFNFKTTGSVTAIGNNSIRVNWQGFPTVSYKIFVAERLPTGLVAYNGFVSSTATVSGVSSTIINNLLEGHEYCAIAVATYADQMTDGPDGTTFNSDVSSTLSSAAWSVGPSGTFGDSKIASDQQCVRTLSSFSISNIKIYAPKASLSQNITFYVSDPSDSTPNDNIGNNKFDIYQANPTTGLSTLVGTIVGAGTMTTQTALSSGKYQFYAVVTDLINSSQAQAKEEIIVGSVPGTVPTSAAQRQYVYVRNLGTTEDPNAPTGYYPSLQQGGMGAQSAGSSVAMGDFNCDGHMDMAIGVPNASVMAADGRPAETGKVVIFYDVTSGTPSATARTQTITFDITQYAGDTGRNLRLGTKLYVGNFNNDNYNTNQYGNDPTRSGITCDDLAIGSGYGPMFVLYGTRDTVSGYGGLNYYNSTSYSLNPSSSCDPSSNVCEPAMYAFSTFGSVVGKSFTSGDFNGDGYEDLVASTSTSNGGNTLGVWVFRGSEYGLIPPASNNTTGEVVNFSSGPYTSFPYIPASTTYPNAGTGSDPSFASAMAPFKNAFYDYSAGNGTKRVRDMLALGNPNYGAGTGRVNICTPKTTGTPGFIPFTSDANTDLAWDCLSQKIDPPTDRSLTPNVIQSGLFGISLAGVKNPLLYQRNEFTDPVCGIEGFANCSATSLAMGYPGALAIGNTTQAKVFLYYLVNNPSTSSTRDNMGADRNTYITHLFNQLAFDGTTNLTIASGATLPCAVGAVTAGVESCNIQALQHPTNAGGGFAAGIYPLPGTNAGSVTESPNIAKQTILAITSPNRAITLSGGITFGGVGSVQLYYQNSMIDSNPISVMNTSGACASVPSATNICRYSQGFSTSMSSSLDYDGTLSNNLGYGSGGVASGALLAASINSEYNANSDIIVGTPGLINQTTVNGNATKVYNNGAAVTFFSHAGTYRPYYGANPSDPTANSWHVVNNSYSQEADMKFHQAVSLGDINGDGIDDIAVRISQGTKNKIRIFYGNTNSVGFTADSTVTTTTSTSGVVSTLTAMLNNNGFTSNSTTTTTGTNGSTTTVSDVVGNYTDFVVQNDASAGIRTVPLGKITNGQYRALLMTGTNSSYIFFGGVTGMIQGVPSAFAFGGTPRQLSGGGNFADTTNNYFANTSLYTGYLGFADSNIQNSETIGNLDSELPGLSVFAHGDFNGDGIEDFAIAFNGTTTIADVNPASQHLRGDPTSNGRVMIFYGGNDNGFQTQPDSSGGFPKSSAYMTDYSSEGYAGVSPNLAYPSGAPNSSISGNIGPCSSATGTGCLIQMLYEPGMANYGSSIAAVPVGNCVVNGVNVPVKALVVKGQKSTGSFAKLYVYKPKCLGTTNDLSGLMAYNGTTMPGISGDDSVLPIPTALLTDSTFGASMTAVQNAMGPSATITTHLVVTSTANSTVVVYPIQTYNAGTGLNFLTYADNGSLGTPAYGGRVINYSSSALITQSTGVVSTGASAGTNNGFGIGITSIGDVNGDGFSDVAIGITKLDNRQTSTTVTAQGAALILFGGTNGFQSHSDSNFLTAITPSTTAFCYNLPGGSGISSVCNPTLLFLPQPTNSSRNGAFERFYINPYSFVNFGSINSNLGTFLLGAPGRDSLQTDPTQRILSGGAFYVLP